MTSSPNYSQPYSQEETAAQGHSKPTLHLSTAKKSQEEETCSEARPPAYYIFHTTHHCSAIKSRLFFFISCPTQNKEEQRDNPWVKPGPCVRMCVLILWCYNSIRDREDRHSGHRYVFFSILSNLLFWSRARLTAICQLRRQSPHYHQGVMRQIALRALISSQRAVEREDMGGVVGVWGRTWMGWGGIQRWLDSLQSAVRNRQETSNRLVWGRHNGTSIAPAKQVRLRHRSEMLSLSLWWHAKAYLHHQGKVIVFFVQWWIVSPGAHSFVVDKQV